MSRREAMVRDFGEALQDLVSQYADHFNGAVVHLYERHADGLVSFTTLACGDNERATEVLTVLGDRAIEILREELRGLKGEPQDDKSFAPNTPDQ